MTLLDSKERRLAKKRFFQKVREYDRKKAELRELYFEVLRMRELAGVDDEVERPELYEVPEYIPGQTISIRR